MNNLIVESTASSRTTSAFKSVINDFTTRGVKGTANNMYLTAIVSGATTVTGANVAFTAAYPVGTAPAAVTTGNITITPTAVADYYSGSGSGGAVTGSDGFYKEATCTITLGTGLLVPSKDQYTVTLSRSSTGLTSAGGSTAYTGSTYSFYYDNLTGNPGTPSISAFALGSVTTTQICGVNVIIGTPQFTASYTVTNLGNYYYRNPLINYSSGSIINANETTIPSYATNVTSGKLNATTSVTSAVISGQNVASVFATTIPLTITAYNINGSTAGNGTSISAIIDGLSYALVQSMSSIPNLSSDTPVVGCRIWSGTSPGTYEITGTFSNSNLLNSSASYSASLYDNTQSIATGSYVNELQVASGAFRTKGSSDTVAYLDYTTLKYGNTNTNTLNYSGITATAGTYRYATFAWKIPSNTATSYCSVKFTINSPSSSPAYSSNVASIGGENIKLFYRIEDATNSASLAVGSSISTNWIDANSKTGNAVNASNYTNPGSYAPYYGVTITGTTNGTSYSVFIPATSWTGSTYLYCRIGLPMSQAFSFTSISANLETNTY